MQFSVSYNRFNRALLTVLGCGPRRTWVDVDLHAVTVHMGYAFTAVIARSSVTAVTRTQRRFLSAGVHGWWGQWLVNGSSQGLVTITVGPSGRGRVLGVPVKVRTLIVSLADPDGFLAAVGSAPSG